MLADIELKPKNIRKTKRSRQTTGKVMNIVTTWLPLLVGEWQWAEDRCRRLWSDHFAEVNSLKPPNGATEAWRAWPMKRSLRDFHSILVWTLSSFFLGFGPAAIKMRLLPTVLPVFDSFCSQ